MDCREHPPKDGRGKVTLGSYKTLPLSNRLLKQAYQTLMKGARGEHKQPGEFRSTQSWIGRSSPTDAAFIPPHQDGVPELMSDLEQFWHNDSFVVDSLVVDSLVAPHSIRIAISHYQFETIHPFLDGTGRNETCLNFLVRKG